MTDLRLHESHIIEHENYVWDRYRHNKKIELNIYDKKIILKSGGCFAEKTHPEDPRSIDGQHCDCWWDAEKCCCFCGWKWTDEEQKLIDQEMCG